MKYLLNALFLMIFSSTTLLASTPDLKTAYDEFNYALTVEWDQKDEGFYKQQMELFEAKILEAKAQGTTDQELLDFALSNVKNQKTVDEFKSLTKTIDLKAMSTEQFDNLTSSIAEGMYASGASWNGRTTIAVAIVSVVTIVCIVAAQDFNSSRSNKDKR